MPLIDVRVYYLQMLSRPNRTTPPAPLTVSHVQHPTVRYYRFLYGRGRHRRITASRARFSDEQLAVVLARPETRSTCCILKAAPRASSSSIDSPRAR